MTENDFKEMIVDKTNEWLLNKVLKVKDAYQVEATYLTMVCQSLAKQLETEEITSQTLRNIRYYLQQLYRITDITQQKIEYNEELIKKMNILLAD